jgi:hypothetical protein
MHVAPIVVGAKDWKTTRDICEHLDWVMFANSFTRHPHPADYPHV